MSSLNTLQEPSKEESGSPAQRSLGGSALAVALSSMASGASPSDTLTIQKAFDAIGGKAAFLDFASPADSTASSRESAP